jgi:outer membrane protein
MIKIKNLNFMKLITNVFLFSIITLTSFGQNEPKTGYTNIEYLISKLPEVKKISEELEKQKKQYDQLYEQKVKTFQEKLASYQKSGNNLPEIIKKDKEKELETLQASIQDLQQKAEKDLSEKQGQMIQPLYVKVYGAIQTVAETNGYKFIFNTGNSNSMRHLLVAPTDGDVSELVLKQLGANAKDEVKTTTKKEVVPTKAEPKAEKATAKKPTTKVAPAKKKK